MKNFSLKYYSITHAVIFILLSSGNIPWLLIIALGTIPNNLIFGQSKLLPFFVV
jgi:hypothetical protein